MPRLPRLQHRWTGPSLPAASPENSAPQLLRSAVLLALPPSPAELADIAEASAAANKFTLRDVSATQWRWRAQRGPQAASLPRRAQWEHLSSWTFRRCL